MTDETLNTPAIRAAIELVGRTGATALEFGYLHDDVPTEDAGWWARARYRGAQVTLEDQRGPVEALTALAFRLLHGALCVGCGKLIAVTDDPVPIPEVLANGRPVDPAEMRRRGLCQWRRRERRWERGCGENAPAGSTREKLAAAMADAGAPTDAIRLARSGRYDEFLSADPFPIMSLVADLEHNGFPELAQRARDGEFDSTPEESKAWAESEDGQAAFAELASGAGRPSVAGRSGKARKTHKKRKR